jgi:hypothetical protein
MKIGAILLSSVLVVRDYLSDHPQIGLFSGFGSGLFLAITSFFTNEAVIKAVGICGVWLGFLIAIMTVFIKFFEFIKSSVDFYKKWKKP